MSGVDEAAGTDRTKGWSADQGSGTLMVIGVVALAMVLACAGIVCAAFLVSLNRAQDIADMSALAGADIYATARLADVQDKACQVAQEVAESNGAQLSSCRCEGVDTIVSLRLKGAWGWVIVRSARAGVDPVDALEGPAPRLAPQVSHQHSASFPKSLSVWHPRLSGVQLSMT